LICRLGIVFQSDGPPVGLTRPWWKRAILAAAVLVPIAAFFICKPLFIDAHRQAALDRLAAERAAAHVEPVEPVEHHHHHEHHRRR
jgi:ABC-type nickel/cobalt efflux system permease component RcnA